jgi:hypothetical protein
VSDAGGGAKDFGLMRISVFAPGGDPNAVFGVAGAMGAAIHGG